MHSLRVQIFSFIAAILLILLLLLNTYPMTSSRDMVFEEKHSAMSSQATVIASSLSGLDRLTKESVAEVLRILDIGGYARTGVTDAGSSCMTTGAPSMRTPTLKSCSSRSPENASSARCLPAKPSPAASRCPFTGRVRPWAHCTSMNTTRSGRR